MILGGVEKVGDLLVASSLDCNGQCLFKVLKGSRGAPGRRELPDKEANRRSGPP